MAKNTPIRMPEILVYGRTIFCGLVLAEITHVAFIGSAGFGNWLANVLSVQAIVAGLVFCVYVLIVYGLKRQVIAQLRRIVASCRIDLLIAAVLGVVVDFLVASKLVKVHDVIARQDIAWAFLVLVMLVTVLLASVIRDFVARRSEQSGQMRFLSDDEIKDELEDMLGIKEQAKEFAETVMAVGAQKGLVFGLDAPWGTGKTSFLNLAEGI